MLPYQPDFIPHHRRGAEVLLESAGWDLEILSPEQITAIRSLYSLDDDRSLEQRVRDGSFLTDGIEDETTAINQRGGS